MAAQLDEHDQDHPENARIQGGLENSKVMTYPLDLLPLNNLLCFSSWPGDSRERGRLPSFRELCGSK